MPQVKNTENGDSPVESVTYRGDADAPVGTPDWLIAKAIEFERERSILMSKITRNRDTLRGLDEQDGLNDAQADFLDTFYPTKERGERRSKEDIERTRKAREAARKAA